MEMSLYHTELKHSVNQFGVLMKLFNTSGNCDNDIMIPVNYATSNVLFSELLLIFSQVGIDVIYLSCL